MLHDYLQETGADGTVSKEMGGTEEEVLHADLKERSIEQTHVMYNSLNTPVLADIAWRHPDWEKPAVVDDNKPRESSGSEEQHAVAREEVWNTWRTEIVKRLKIKQKTQCLSSAKP